MAHKNNTYGRINDNRTIRAEGANGETYYEEDPESGSEGSYFSEDYEPAWAASVGEKGDLFYVEPPEGSIIQHTPSHNNNGRTENNKELNNAKKNNKGIKKLKGLLANKKHDPKIITNSNHTSSNGPKVTFQDIPTGILKDVKLFVDPNRHNYGRRATLCETLFGIIPGHFSSKPYVDSSHGGDFRNGGVPNRDTRIMVHGLTPEGEAIKTGEIKIGDWLMSVNDLEVNFDNIDSIISAITSPKYVKITFQKLSVDAQVISPVSRKPDPNNEKLVKLLQGERLNDYIPSVENIPHVAMYLTLEASSDSERENEDVVYYFPRRQSKLMEIRGLFITLAHMLQDVTNNTAKNSTLLVDEQLIHVTYSKEVHEVLVIAVPASRVPLVQLNYLMKDIDRMLKYSYGSLGRAFSNSGNHGKLDHLFSLTFQRVLLYEELRKAGLQVEDPMEAFLDALHGVRCITLPQDTKVNVNNCLSELEASDFAEMSDDYYDLRRSYTMLGSTLFYKGYLLASHLHKEDLYDISLYLRYYCLLALSASEQQLGQLVVWKEVFPHRRCREQVDPLIPGYTEPDARWFILIVGLKNHLLGVLLEAGGCAAWAEGNPTPDPFYVDQVKATLLQLESVDIAGQCEAKLHSIPAPSLVCADWFFQSNKGGKDEAGVQGSPRVQNSPKTGSSPGARKLLQPEPILKKKPSPLLDRKRALAGYCCLQMTTGSLYELNLIKLGNVRSVARQFATVGNGNMADNMADTVAMATTENNTQGVRGAVLDLDSDIDSNHSTGNSATSTPIMHRHDRKTSVDSDESIGSAGSSGIFRISKKKRAMAAYDMSNLRFGLSEAVEEQGAIIKLTSGLENTLFHYVNLDSLEGVYICPSQQEMEYISGNTHKDVITNFHQSCLSIRKLFENTLTAREEASGGECHHKLGRDSSLDDVHEHGVLFHCSPNNWTDAKKPKPIMTYWVVGRLLFEPYPRECYVCFHDSAAQNMVELAFKLSFGYVV